MLNYDDLMKRKTCCPLLPDPGPEVVKEIVVSHLDALTRLALKDAVVKTARPHQYTGDRFLDEALAAHDKGVGE